MIAETKLLVTCICRVTNGKLCIWPFKLGEGQTLRTEVDSRIWVVSLNLPCIYWVSLSFSCLFFQVFGVVAFLCHGKNSVHAENQKSRGIKDATEFFLPTTCSQWVVQCYYNNLILLERINANSFSGHIHFICILMAGYPVLTLFSRDTTETSS